MKFLRSVVRPAFLSRSLQKELTGKRNGGGMLRDEKGATYSILAEKIAR